MKRAVVVAVLALATFWPLAHRALTAHFEWNPWKLGAFAMYATPTPPVVVALFTEDGGELVLLDEATLDAHARASLSRFRRERHALGRLREPDDVADAVFAARHDLDHLLVVVQRMSLDRRTALMVSTKQSYVYERSALAD